jgi:uncharacterized metal-binding protein
MSFDSGTGKLWIGDVGDETVEEIDIGVAGGNYGWPRCEGNLQGPTQQCVYGSDVAPIFTYPHAGATALGTCLIGGAFAGSAFGSMAGQYIFGDCTSSNIYRLPLNMARDGFAGPAAEVSTNANTPADFVQGPDGAIYYTSAGGGEVRRLAAAPSTSTSTPTITSTATRTRTASPTNTATNTATGTAPATNAAASTATMTPIATATPPTCVGDCDAHHQVTVDEILTMVNIGLGNVPLLDCEAADANHDGQVTVDEIVTAVNNALNGCGQNA